MSKHHLISRQRLVLSSFFLLILSTPIQGWAGDTEARLQEIFKQGWELESKMHINLANLDKAQALYEEAVRIAPKNEEAKWWLAEIIFKKAEEVKDKDKKEKMYTRSAKLAEEAVAINPKSVGGNYWAGTSYARLADLAWVVTALPKVKKAKKYLRAAMAADKNNRYAVLAGVVLASIFADAPWPVKDMEEATKLSKWAASKDRNLTFASLRLGKIHLANDNKEKGKKELERCLNIKNPTYIWDAKLYDWPEAKKILSELK